MSADDEEKARLEREIYRTIIHRDSRQTNIIEVLFLPKILIIVLKLTLFILFLVEKLQSYL